MRRWKKWRLPCWCAADKFPYVHGLVLEQLYPTSQLLAELISFAPAPNKAVVGSNAFAHEAGIHQHGMLAHPLTYEIMTPASVGVPNNRMVLGKHSGRRALAHRLKELGYALMPPISIPSTTASTSWPITERPSSTRT